MNSQSSWDQPGCDALWGNMVVNHLKFADDICVFRPSISGLQCLLNICGDYAAEHKKSLLIVTKQLVFFFAQKSINNLPHQIFF